MESKAGSEGEKETGLRQAMLNIIDQSEKMQLYSRWDRKPAAKDGNIARFAMCLPCKPKDLILIPRTHAENQTQFMLVIPVVGRQTQEDPWSRLAHSLPTA